MKENNRKFLGLRKYAAVCVIAALAAFGLQGCATAPSDAALISSGAWFEAVYATWSGPADGTFTAQISADGRSWSNVDQALVRNSGGSNWRVDVPGLAADNNQTYSLRVRSGRRDVLRANNLAPRPFDRQGYAFYTGPVTLYNGRQVHFPNGTTGGHNPDGTVAPGTEIIYVTHENMHVLSGLSLRTTPTVVRFIGRVGRAGGRLPYVNFQHHLVIQGAQNITFEGVGPDAVIEGWGILSAESDNIIIRNLTFEHARHDAVWTRGPSSHNWVTHNTFLVSGDGASDQGSGTTNFTISYNLYIGTIQNMLANGNPGEAEHRGTYHHNWFFFVDARAPRLRATQAHIFNNLFDHSGQGPVAGERASMIAEGNVFLNTATGAALTGRGAEGVLGVSGQGFGGGMAGGVGEGPGMLITSAMPATTSGAPSGFTPLNRDTLAAIQMETGRSFGTDDLQGFINALVPNYLDAASAARFNPFVDNAIRPLPRGEGGATTQIYNNSGHRNIGNIGGGNNLDTHLYIFQPFNPRQDTPGFIRVSSAAEAADQVRSFSGTMRETGAVSRALTYNPQTHIQQPIISFLSINSNGSFVIRTARSPWATGYTWEWDQGTGAWAALHTSVVGGPSAAATPNVANSYTFVPAGITAAPGRTYRFRVTAFNDRAGASSTSEAAAITAPVINPSSADLISREGLNWIVFSENFDTMTVGPIRDAASLARFGFDFRRFPYMFRGLPLNAAHFNRTVAGVQLDGSVVVPDPRFNNALFPDTRRIDAVVTNAANAFAHATFGQTEGGLHHAGNAGIAGIQNAAFNGNALMLRDWNWNNHSDQERYAAFMHVDIGSEIGGRVSISYDFMLNRSAAAAGSDIFPVQLYDASGRLIMARRANTSSSHFNHFDPGLALDQPTWQENTNVWINLEVVLDFSAMVFDVYLNGAVYEYGVPIPSGIRGVRYILANTNTGNHGTQTMNLLIDNIVVRAN